MTITYDHQNIFIAQGKGDNVIKLSNSCNLLIFIIS
jgi:hypothetical protein